MTGSGVFHRSRHTQLQSWSSPLCWKFSKYKHEYEKYRWRSVAEDEWSWVDQWGQLCHSLLSTPAMHSQCTVYTNNMNEIKIKEFSLCMS